MRKIALISLLVSGMLVLSSLSANPSAQGEILIHSYYKDKSYERFFIAIKEFSYYLMKNPNYGEKLHLLNIGSTFLAHALKENPDYLIRYEQNLQNVTACEQAFFFRAIRAAGIEHYGANNITHYGVNSVVNFSNIIYLSNLDSLIIQKEEEMDYLWASFFATGDNKYIHKIMQFLNRDNEVLAYVFEWMNREKIAEFESLCKKKRVLPDLSDLLKHIEARNKEKPGFSKQIVLARTALWSLESNAEQDPMIRKEIQSISSMDPSLDYRKKNNELFSR